MASASDGMNYAPQGKPEPVVEPGEFCFAVAAMDHGHIFGQTNGLTEAGATLKYVFDKADPDKARKMAEERGAQHVTDLDVILNDDEVQLVAAAAIPNERAPLGVACMNAGKHYFTDKTPLVSLDQLSNVWDAVKRTGKKYMVYYSERLHVESAGYAGQLIEQGAIGRVVHMEITGPHRVGDYDKRPDWFYKLDQYGGIICDIGSHQIDQFLYYAGCKDATVSSAHVGNYGNPGYPELQDFGDYHLVGDNGTTMYGRVDWFTPHNFPVFGDGRAFIIGTEGFIEIRKYIDVTTDNGGNQVFLSNADGQQRFSVSGQVGYPYFGRLIRDCLDGTETAMTQEHALKTAELCVKAQAAAVKVA